MAPFVTQMSQGQIHPVVGLAGLDLELFSQFGVGLFAGQLATDDLSLGLGCETTAFLGPRSSPVSEVRLS